MLQWDLSGDEQREGQADAAVTADQPSDDSGQHALETLPAGERAQELEPGLQLGRYVIVSRLGAGGMGVVYSAYDPELERRVAIKILRAKPGAGSRTRLLREAQAMAKLSHPNVVTVFDVGTHGRRVYLAMEFVDGHTVPTWIDLTKPPVGVVLEVFRQAARGLAAAHAAGFVHRDFKPDNLLVDVHGHARVMDFGLARATGHPESLTADRRDRFEASCGASHVPRSIDALDTPLTQDGVVVGTPAYMAPEQHVGRQPSAATDQFSYCAALFEALCGKRPFAGKDLRALALAKARGDVEPFPDDRQIPERVRRVIVRGLSAEVERRFPSMQALLAALDVGLRPWHRRAALPLIAASAAGVAWLGVAIAGDENGSSESCGGAEAQLGSLWNQARKRAVQDAMIATGLEFAADTWSRTEAGVDGYAEAWAAMHTEACEASGRGEQSDAVLDMRMRCLAQRRSELGATLDLLADADAMVVEHAVSQVSKLGGVARCGDVDALHAAVEPPQDQNVREQVDTLRARSERVRALELAGRYTEGLARAEELVRDAAEVDYPPLRAEVLIRLGSLQHATGAHHDAEQTLSEASWEASSAGHDRAAADAATRLVFLVSEELGRPDEAMQWVRHAEAALDRVGDSGDDGQLARARLRSNVGILHSSAGRYGEALAAFDAAYNEKKRLLGDRHPEVAGAIANIALAMSNLGRLGDAKKHHERALAIFTEALGERHPDVAQSLNNLGNVADELGEHDAAVELYNEALSIWEGALGPNHFLVAHTFDNLGMAYAHLGKPREALDYHRRALALLVETLGEDDQQLAYVHGNLGGTYAQVFEYEKSRSHYEKALEILLATVGEEHDRTAHTMSNLGMSLLDLERYDEAEVYLSRALEVRIKTLGPKHPEVARSYNTLGFLHGHEHRWDKARELHQKGLDLLLPELGPDHPEVAAIRLDLGFVALATKNYREAQAHLQPCVEALETRAIDPIFLADARFALAQAMWHLRTDRREALALARQALPVFERSGEDYEDAVHDVRRWLAGHRDSPMRRR